MPSAGAIRAGQGYVEIVGDNQKLRQATKQAEGYLRELDRAARDVGKAVNNGWLENIAAKAKEARREQRMSGETALMRDLSSGQGLAQFASQSLGVGLPVMIAEQLGKGFATATEKAAELRKQLREGKITEEEMIRGLATGVPVIGEWVKGFLNIRDYIEGDKAAIEKVNEEMKAGEALMQTRMKSAEIYRDIIERIAKKTAEISTNMAGNIVGATPVTKAEAAYENEKRAIDEARTKNSAAINPDADKYAEEELKAVTQLEEKHRKITELYKERSHAEAEAAKERGPRADSHQAEAKANLAYITPQYTAAMNEINAARKRMNDKRQEIIDKTAGELDAREQQNEQNRTNAIKQAGVDRVSLDARTAQERLHSQNKLYEAEKVGLAKELNDQLKMVDENTAAQLAIAKEHAGTAKGNSIIGEGEKLKESYRAANAAKLETAANRQYALERQYALDIEEAKIAGMEDVHAKELANLGARYNAAMDVAKKSGAETKHITDKYEADKAAMLAQHARQNEDRQRESAGRLADLQAAGIQDRNRRELAEIDARYKRELEHAKAHPGERNPADVQNEWGQARANALARQAADMADANRDMDTQLEKARVASTQRGLQARLSDIEIERQAALAREHDPRYTKGIGDAKINELFDLEKQAALMRGESTRGTFNGLAMQQFDTGKKLSDSNRSAQHLQMIAGNSKAIEPLLRTALSLLIQKLGGT